MNLRPPGPQPERNGSVGRRFGVEEPRWCRSVAPSCAQFVPRIEPRAHPRLAAPSGSVHRRLDDSTVGSPGGFAAGRSITSGKWNFKPASRYGSRTCCRSSPNASVPRLRPTVGRTVGSHAGSTSHSMAIHRTRGPIEPLWLSQLDRRAQCICRGAWPCQPPLPRCARRSRARSTTSSARHALRVTMRGARNGDRRGAGATSRAEELA